VDGLRGEVFDNIFSRRYNRWMTLKAAVLAFPVILLLSETGSAQREAPLFLDARNGDDPFVIDITEVTGQYSKAAVEEYQKGIADGRKGNRAAAEEHLRAAIRIEPTFFNAHNSLAILFHRTLRYEDARREYEEAARLNPRSIAPLVNASSVLVEQSLSISAKDSDRARGLLNQALASLNKAFEVQPNAPLADYWTGVVYYLTGFYEEAESHFKKALASGDPRMTVAHLALADIYVHLFEWDSVVVQLDEYLEAAPYASNRARIRIARSLALEKLESPSK
jgi:tetratricopeptide (TPR) repeat protein